jgi:DNA-binding transcriptional MerR regulator
MESGYKVGELARMFTVSRQTIYSKLKCQEIRPYITQSDKGKVLSLEGLERLRLLLADSMIDNKVNNKLTSKEAVQMTYLDKYVQRLEDQVSKMEARIRELETVNNALMERILQRDVLMLPGKTQGGIIARLFGRGRRGNDDVKE